MMQDENKTKAQLITELQKARKQIAEIESTKKNLQKPKEELNSAEADLKNIFNISPGLICVANANTGYFTECNPAVTQILGISVEEFMARPFMEFVHPQDRQRTVDEITKQLSGSSIANFENRYRCKDGSYKWLAWQATAADKNGKVYAVAMDITERRQVEEALRESELLLSIIYEAAFEGILIHDKGVIIMANKHFADMLGYELNELIGKQLISFAVAPEAIEYVKKQIAINGKGPYESLVLRKDGTKLPIEVRAAEIIINNRKLRVATCIDITERKKAEEALRQSEERLDLAINGANMGMWDWDIRTGSVTHNERWAGMLGYKLEELAPNSNTWKTLMHPEDKDRVIKILNQHFENSDFEYNTEFRMKSKSGNWRWINARGRIVAWDEENKPLRMVGTHIDITEHKEMELILRHSEKMEAIGHLAGGIAHDFNNILSGIFGYAEITLKYTPKNSLIAKNIEKILKAGERAKHLVNQILLFSRQSEEYKAPVSIGPIIKEAAQLIRASLPSSIIIKRKIVRDTKPVLAEATKIHEIIVNLCTNAAHAMKDKGILEISYSEKHLVSELEGRIGIINPGFYSVITIKDSGCGMSKELLSHIFEPFFTTKAVGHGTGMGLAVVYGIIKSHQGNIIVESEPNIGTKFEIYLPKTDEALLEDDDKDAIIQGGTESVLFVDDEEILNDVIKDLLSDLGYKVTVFTDSMKAIDAFEKAPESFDLVITDQTMPVLNGLELSKELLHIRQSIPIILYTGYSKLVNEEKAFKAGIKGFLIKPIIKRELAYKIRYILDNEHL